MRLFIRGYARAVVAGALAVAVLSCGDSTAPTGATVSVEDDQFDPSTATIAVGEKVVWTWDGANQHNVTWDAAGPTNSTTLTTGTFEQTFNTAGTFPYHCTIHGAPGTGMQGSITVN